MIRIETERLVLRGWREDDLAPFAAMNADPRVMRHFPRALTEAQSRSEMERAQALAAEHGFCFQPVEEKASGAFVGIVGLSRVQIEAPFVPAVEIGWRLARAHWGKGYASEAAAAWLGYGFDALGLKEIVSFTVAENQRSRAVMGRIGMTRDPLGDFDHPALPAGHPLRRHLLYRMSSRDFADRRLNVSRP